MGWEALEGWLSWDSSYSGLWAFLACLCRLVVEALGTLRVQLQSLHFAEVFVTFSNIF